jgi:hypothetical protein
MEKKILGIFIFTLLIVGTVMPVTGNLQKKPVSPIISTSVDKISPYNIPSSNILITATGPSDLDAVTLYYRWSKDNITWTGLQKYSIFEDFESGSQNTSLWNIYQSGNDARIQWNYGISHNGTNACAMDDHDTNQNDASLNVIYTLHDFTNANHIKIDFWEREWGDEAHNAPDSWTGWGNYDVVAFTNDGNTWYELVSESDLNKETYTQFEVNITEHPDFSSPATSSFAIAFQQYDNYQLNDDGRAWDDITIDYSIGVASINWSSWVNPSNPDTSYPWSWSFGFPKGPGYYEFYSIGVIYGEEIESAPSVADAICRYTRQPEISDEFPENGSTDINIKPRLEISVDDADNDKMNINWYSNTSGTWKIFGKNKDVEGGTYTQNNKNFSDFGTTYYWYVTVTDSIFTVSSPIFHFTTEENKPPNTPNDPDPADKETEVSINKVISWQGGDPNQGDKVYYDVYFGTSSSPPLVAEDITNTAYDPGTMELGTTYYWKIISEDNQGEIATGPIWEFTTEIEANYPPTKPDIYGSPRGPPGIELCWLFISEDPEDHQIKYKIDWGDGNSHETDYNPSDEPVEACHIYESEGDYTIKIIPEDEKGLEGQENSFTIKIQRSRAAFYKIIQRFLERIQNVFPILRNLIDLY